MVENFEEDTATRRHTLETWSKESIVQIYRRRYLQRMVGLEFCCSSNNTALFIFHKPDFSDAYTAVRGLNLEQLSGPFHDDNTAGDELGPGLQAYLADLQQRWMRGEVSNLAYLMRLNTLAGRTCNDLTQYPVFPWVLSDYSSSELDLDDPAVYRDLTKPMGAQDPNRHQMFVERYEALEESDDPNPNPPNPNLNFNFNPNPNPYPNLTQNLMGP